MSIEQAIEAGYAGDVRPFNDLVDVLAAPFAKQPGRERYTLPADADEEVNGWLVTPGGRIWYIDSERGVTRQICGRNCVPADPNFEPEVFGPIKKSYTLRDLERRDAEG